MYYEKHKMKIKRLVAVAAIIGTQVVPGIAHAEDQSETIQKLIKRIEELEQKVKVQDRKYELDKEATDAKVKEQPKITIGEKGFSFGTADGNFNLKLKGLIQTDYRAFFGDNGIKGNDGFILRRVRPIIEGTVYKDFDFQFVPDFGGTAAPVVQDAWLNYRLAPELQFKIGKFKTPVGLELLQSDSYLPFNERSLVTDLVPNRDLGIQVWGEAFGGSVNYALGLFNGIADGGNTTNADFDDSKSVAGRLFFQPFKPTDIIALQGLGFGVGGDYQNTTTATGITGGYKTDGQQNFFTYNPAAGTTVAAGGHWRLSPQLYYYWGPFGLLAEYAISDQRVRNGAANAYLQDTAWQVTASWVLTGEDLSYSAGVIPKHSFAPLSGDWGAFQLVARVAELSLDKNTFPTYANLTSSAQAAHEWSVGLNWWLNRNVRILTSFSHTSFTGGGTSAAVTAPAVVTRQDENLVFTRFQIGF